MHNLEHTTARQGSPFRDIHSRATNTPSPDVLGQHEGSLVITDILATQSSHYSASARAVHQSSSDSAYQLPTFLREPDFTQFTIHNRSEHDGDQGRDLLSIYNKVIQVLYPLRKGEARVVLR